MTVSNTLLEVSPLLFAMLGLMCASAFYSASEAALFSLRAADRTFLRRGNRAQQLANHLLDDPDRLLSSVLFWNLVVNIGYFTLASTISIRLSRLPAMGTALFACFSTGSLLMIIFFSEMLPKTLAVLNARKLSAWVSVPLSLSVRAAAPLMPALHLVNLLSRRLIWPTFAPETYLHVEDLERAIKLSTQDANLIDREQRVLHNLVSLSELRVDECMCPRSRLARFQRPVHWPDIATNLPADGVLYITDRDSDEIVSVLDLNMMTDLPRKHLERWATEVEYVPWAAKAADVLQAMDTRAFDTVAVVNEQGETIGVVHRKDLLDVVFTLRPSRSERLLNREPIVQLDNHLWQVTGLSNLRTLEEHFRIELPESGSVTVAGVVQECLQRLPKVGDKCEWGPFQFEVTEAETGQPILVRLNMREATEGPS